MAKSPGEQQYSPSRAYPRLPLDTPVEIHYGDNTLLCRTENISVGGLLAQCRNAPPASTKLTVLFNLPNGTTIRTYGIVRHRHRGKFGVQFDALTPSGREALEGFTARMENSRRRGDRKSKRLHVTICSTQPGHEHAEEMAETVLLSQNGGLMICRARFDTGERLQLYWPDRKQTAEILIVFRRPCGTGDLVELGFEFLEAEDFWGVDFQTH